MKKLKSKLKLVFVGFIFGLIFNSCDDNILQADGNNCNGWGSIGSTEWNPLYVKIVD